MLEYWAQPHFVSIQIPHLTRLGQSLKLVNELFWIVAEDADATTPQGWELFRF